MNTTAATNLYPAGYAKPKSPGGFGFWSAVAACLLLIVVFNTMSLQASVLVAVAVWFLISAVLVKRVQLVLPLLLLAACYERPVLDLGLGIRGTIKLTDIVILGLVTAAFLSSFSSKRNFRRVKWDAVSLSFAGLVVIAICSAAWLRMIDAYNAETVRLSTYYAIKVAQYFIAFLLIRAISFSEREIRFSIYCFLAGLAFVSVFAILQGLGILPVEYYSKDAAIARVDQEWSISTLGPNHTHLGTYMVLAVVLSLVAIESGGKRYLNLGLIVLALAGLAFSHSATGIGMLIIYFGLLFLLGSTSIKKTLVWPGLVLLVVIVFYLAGAFGGSAARTTGKFAVATEESDFVRRSVGRPLAIFAYLADRNPAGVIFGYGFRARDVAVEKFGKFGRIGDNNYYSVAIDVGMVGLMLYFVLLAGIYKRLKIAKSKNQDVFQQLFSFNIFLLFPVMMIAMLTQEILWPLHSRGTSMLIFLVIFEMATRIFVVENDQKKPQVLRSSA